MVYPLLVGASSKRCLFALLIDPDKYNVSQSNHIAQRATDAGVDLILVGGSLITNSIAETISVLKLNTKIPIVLFPGSPMQFNSSADAILLLSLISGRNADYLIGNHVQVALQVKNSGVEVIPTGYVLIDGGSSTSVQYMSNTTPIPAGKTDIAVATCVAGEMLGLKTLYLEAGSGAINPVPPKVIEAVRGNVNIPIIVGGGIRTPEQVKNAKLAGSSMVVVGSAIEDNPTMLDQLVKALQQ
jgi:putative glycerol-1-phosphate prenyltransferase